jgi:nitrogen fixation protein NifU and related proteins
MLSDLNDLYQQVILDHSRRPQNFLALPDANRTAQGRNPLCGDQLTVYVHLEGDVIQKVTFQGSGCAISQASASIMTTLLQGKTRAEAMEMFNQFHGLVQTGESPNGDLGKLNVFAGVHKFPARVKCAILAWHALAAALEGRANEIVSTESNTGN